MVFIDYKLVAKGKLVNERRHVEDVQNHESHERSVCILYGYQSSARYKTASPCPPFFRRNHTFFGSTS